MLKIVVYDGGYGGELFADQLEEALPVVEVIRVIDWRNSSQILENSRGARLAAEKALRPYVERVDLIILANYLLTSTSLEYFRRKYKGQKFLGSKLPLPGSAPSKKRPIILTTKAFAKTLDYYRYLLNLKRRSITICLDRWVELIDDGELSDQMVYREIEKFYLRHHYKPTEIIIGCSHFCDAVPLLRNNLNKNLKVYDGFKDTIDEACKILKIRGGTGKKKKK